jgi:hypothetical protein
VFSIAMTAWSAKVVTNSICFSVNRSIAKRAMQMTPITTPSRSSGTPNSVWHLDSRSCSLAS